MSKKSEELLSRLGVPKEATGAHAGEWLSASGELQASLDPTSGETLAEVRGCTPSEARAVVDRAAARFLEWRMRPAPKRGELVRRLGELLREHKVALGELVSLEMGKIRAEGLGEVQEMIDVCDFAVGLSRQLHGLTIASERPQHRMIEQWHPLGPVAVITAFNFPVAVWAWNAALAAVAGDTCVWKPSPRTPLASLAVQALCNRAADAEDARGVLSLAMGGADVGVSITEDPRVPLVSFTGSVAVGRDVAVRVAKRLGRSILELGGNNAVIALDDADVEMVVRAVTFGAVGTTGQRCTSTRRLFLQRGIARSVTERLSAAFRSVPIGDPLADGTLVGPLVGSSSVRAYRAALEKAVAQGGEIVAGGRVLERPGFFVEPALVRAPRHDAFPIAWEETFAPILYVFEVADLDEAIAAQNAVPQGLSSALFTDSVRASERFLSAAGSDCGIANINLGTSGAEIGGAFGGEKATGGGRESGSDSWKAYMRRATNTVNYSKDLPLAQGIRFDL